MAKSARTGLAGYVRTGPRFGSLLIGVLLLPFWVSSEIAQARWRDWQKIVGLAALWGLMIGTVAALALPREDVAEQVVAGAATPTAAAIAASPSVAPTLTPPAEVASASPIAASRPSPVLTVPPVVGELFKGLRVSREPPRSGYDRELFNHWIDADDNGCDTRDEVLIKESLEPITVGPNCQLSGGRWYSVYDGVTTTQPGTFDIDHFVPLAEAWDSGASSWSSERRRDFANDLGYGGSLIAVTASSNRSKSDQDPGKWQPELESYDCTYAKTWIKVKDRWDLTVDPAEVAALQGMLASC